MKKSYEKPVLIEQSIGRMNKFQASYNEKKATEIDGIPVKRIIEKFGSPVFVFSERELRSTIRHYKRIFNSHFPKIVFAWSYKTNYLDAICSILHSEGCLAEVVSEFEYQKARRLGVPGSKIIFNGPCKRAEIIEAAVEDHAMLNIDNFDEIYRIEEVGAKKNKKVSVGIRINLDVGVVPHWGRFGFNLENGQALQAVKRIHKSERLKLTGIHCHIGTFISSARAYQIAAEKIMQFADLLKSEFKIRLDYVNMGGGFPSQNRLKGIYLSPDFTVPPVEDYAKAIGDVMLEKTNPETAPTVYLESGRAIVDSSGYLISSVVAAKRLPTGRKAYVIDAGINLLITPNWYDIPVKVGIDVQGPAEDAVLYGPLCMNIDIVRDSVQLPPLSCGAPLIFHPVGAYNVTHWMQFIEYRPAIVLISENGELELIRKKECLEDVVRNEVLPERLKFKFE